MSTTEASTPRPHVQLRPVTDQTPVAYTITPAGLAALAQDPSTDISREPTRRTTEEDAA